MRMLLLLMLPLQHASSTERMRQVSLYNLYYIFSYPEDVCVCVFSTNGFWQSSMSTVKAPAASCSAVSSTFGADEVSITRPELRRQLIIKSIVAVFRN